MARAAKNILPKTERLMMLMKSVFLALCLLGKASSFTNEEVSPSPFHVIELTHSPHAVSASRWSGGEMKPTSKWSNNTVSWEQERIEEAWRIQKV
jgi:hypothetical protein